VGGLLLGAPAAWSPDMEASTEPASPLVMALVKNVVLRFDFAFWLMDRLARPMLLGFMATPPELQAYMTPDEQAHIDALMVTLLTVSRQGDGLLLDAANHEARQRAALERITAPTLIVSAEDDLYKTMPGAAYTASQIVGARLLRLERGGHLMVGGQAAAWEETRAALKAFTQAKQPEAAAGRVPA
jgi:pimeloyl-ACP methyl ester carboxylesterase